MDTLSAPVTTFQAAKPFTSNHHHLHNHHLQPTSLSPHQPAAFKTTATSSFSKTKPPHPSSTSKVNNHNPLYSHKTLPSHSFTFTSKPSRATVHCGAASGYAAALVDVAQSNNAVLEVARDVRRLLRVLRNGQVREFMVDEMVGEIEKGEVVKELVEKGKFEGHLVGLVKMVIDKGKRVEMVREILEEFLRIFFQLASIASLGTYI